MAAPFDRQRAAAALMASLRTNARQLKPDDRDHLVVEARLVELSLGDHLARAYQIGVNECLARISELETEIQKVRSDLAASEEAVALLTVNEDSLNSAMRQIRGIVNQALRI